MPSLPIDEGFAYKWKNVAKILDRFSISSLEDLVKAFEKVIKSMYAPYLIIVFVHVLSKSN